MSERRFRRTPAGVCSLGLHAVWCPKHRRGELLEQIAAEHSWQIVAEEVVMSDHVHLVCAGGAGV